ncbi:AsmA family protein [Roseomonas sp. JC162]|uniref:AsmA family protein n=1 Tax=Neoroseomonas marina TaxID=1232220 RepID=A0A848EI48_9PROT|nr:AsmA family protein [Neoroseomonas marina]NMJ43666.1 AsmA family protein [Neoroseomonas marina]
MRRRLRRAAWLLLVLMLLGGSAIAALQAMIARGAFTARVDAALEHATGRAVSHGGIQVSPGLRPRIVLTDATVANIPGGSRPDFARIGRLEVTLALIPLLSGHVEIDSLRLADADLILERNAEGRPNWVFGGGGGGGIGVPTVDIADTRITLLHGPVRDIRVERLRLEREAPHDPLELRGHVRLDGEALTLNARLGPEADGILPLAADIAGDGLRLMLEGSWPRHSGTPGWALAAEAELNAAAARRLATRFGHDLPVAGPLTLKSRLAPGSPRPSISDLTVRLGPTDAARLLPGLRVTRAELRAASFDDPAQLSAQGVRNSADLGLTATLPSPRRMLEAATEEALPVEATVISGRSRLVLRGEVRTDRPLGDAVLAAQLTTPDVASVGPVLGVGLPRLAGVTAEARMSGLFTRTLRLRDLRLAADGIEADGNLDIGFGARPTFRGDVSARRLDLDRLGGGGSAPTRRTERVIPDHPLPIAWLRGADADLRLSAAVLVAGGTTWRDARATVALAGGRLTLDPLAVTMPGGPVSGRFAIDAAAASPRTSLSIRSLGRGLDLSAMRRAFGMPAGFEGTAELALDLHGTGTTTRALAASLGGELGVAMLGGRFTGATALRIGPHLARALMPRGTPADGLALRCLAIRLTAEAGLAHSQALLMEGEFGKIEGSLALNLRDETIAARLLPDVRVLGVTVRAPVAVGGTLADPRIGVEPGAAFARVAGDTVANRLWRSSTVEFLRGATGSTPPGGDCGAALTLARLGRGGAMPEAAATPIPLVPRELQGAAQDVVRGIGGLLGGRRR